MLARMRAWSKVRDLAKSMLESEDPGVMVRVGSRNSTNTVVRSGVRFQRLEIVSDKVQVLERITFRFGGSKRGVT